MQKIMTLSKVMLKSSVDDQFNAFAGKKHSGRKSILLFAFLGLYLGGFFLFLGTMLLDSLISIGQPSIFIYLINLIMPLMILFFTIFSVPVILYYSSDNASYFVLPLKPSEIVAGKAITIYIQTLVTEAVFLVPLFILYFIKVDSSILTILFSLISIFVIPIIPIVFATLLIVLIFTFTPFFRNRETFTYISTTIALLLSLGISQISLFIDSSSMSIENIVTAIQSGDDSLFSMLGSIFPTTRMLAEATVNQSLISLLSAIGLTLVIAFVAFKIAEPFYFKTVLLFTETKKTNKRISLRKLTEESNKKTIVRSVMQYDFRNILRTPAFVTNYYLPYLMIPVFMGFGLFSSFKNLGAIPIAEIHAFMNPFLSGFSPIELIIFTYMVSLSIGLFFTNLGNPTSTMISREGVNVSEFLTFPIKFSSIIKAKIINGLIPTLPIPILILLLGIILIGLPVYLIPVMVIAVVIGGCYVTFIGSWVDMASPRLNWVNEQDAVKGNLRQMFVVLPFMIIPIVLGILLANTQSLYIWGVISLLSCVGIYFLIKFVIHYADTRLIEVLQSK